MLIQVTLNTQQELMIGHLESKTLATRTFDMLIKHFKEKQLCVHSFKM